MTNEQNNGQKRWTAKRRSALVNGLIFQSRRFRAACAFYRLPQECITLYTLEQNEMIER